MKLKKWHSDAVFWSVQQHTDNLGSVAYDIQKPCENGAAHLHTYIFTGHYGNILIIVIFFGFLFIYQISSMDQGLRTPGL